MIVFIDYWYIEINGNSVQWFIVILFLIFWKKKRKISFKLYDDYFRLRAQRKWTYEGDNSTDKHLEMNVIIEMSGEREY